MTSSGTSGPLSGSDSGWPVADGGSPCSGEGATEACYSGAPATQGIGACHDGSRSCSGGTWSACAGQVTPTVESCDTKDNNCDGVIDEGCSCVDGATQPCTTGPPGSSGVGICKSGTQTCESGSWSSTCVGAVGPEKESCNGKDDDCNQACQHLIGSPGGSCGAPTSTDPSNCCDCSAKLNCALCLGANPDCNAACKGAGKAGGYCAYDNSTNPSQCCGCY